MRPRSITASLRPDQITPHNHRILPAQRGNPACGHCAPCGRARCPVCLREGSVGGASAVPDHSPTPRGPRESGRERLRRVGAKAAGRRDNGERALRARGGGRPEGHPASAPQGFPPVTPHTPHTPHPTRVLKRPLWVMFWPTAVHAAAETQDTPLRESSGPALGLGTTDQARVCALAGTEAPSRASPATTAPAGSHRQRLHTAVAVSSPSPALTPVPSAPWHARRARRGCPGGCNRSRR